MEIRKFENVKEFAKYRKLNRLIYSTMTYEEKLTLKKYVYSLEEKQNRKDIIWEYLNEPIGSDYYICVSIVLKSYMRSKK